MKTLRLNTSRAVLHATFLLLASFGFLNQAKSQLFTGGIAGGMGGAGRAAVDGGEAIYLNPASVAQLRSYYIGGHYQLGDHPREGNYSRYSLQVADGTPGNLIPGGFAYTRNSIELPAGAGWRTDTDYQTAVGAQVSQNLALGVSAHYLKQTGQNREDEQINGGLGVLFSPLESLGFAFVGYDIAPINRTASVDRRVIPTFAAGVHYLLPEILSLRLDLVRPDVQARNDYRTNVMTGFESYFHPQFAFRLGGQWLETVDQMNLTAGLGFKGPRLSVDYTFQKDIRSGMGVRHLIDLWMPL